MTVVFDIDGVLCETGSWADYSKAVPYPHAIAQVNAVFDRGHRVVLVTARGMISFGGDAGECCERLYATTFDWLTNHGVKFHELHFGKPSAALYVDDRGCRVESARGMTDWEEQFLPRLAEAEELEKKWGIH